MDDYEIIVQVEGRKFIITGDPEATTAAARRNHARQIIRENCPEITAAQLRAAKYTVKPYGFLDTLSPEEEKEYEVLGDDVLIGYEEDGIVYWNKDIAEGWSLPETETQAGTIRREGPKTGRNDPCPCGSGKKYKKCCGR